MTGDSWSCLLHGAVIQVTRGCKSGRGETPGSHWVHLHLPDKPGQRGAVWAPTPGRVRTAAGLMDALTTEAVQKANPCLGKAAGGVETSGLPSSGTLLESMELITTMCYLLSL